MPRKSLVRSSNIGRDGAGETAKKRSPRNCIKLLEFKRGNGKDIIAKRNITTLGRNMDSLAALAKDVDEVQVKIEERKKLENGDLIDEVGVWSSEIDGIIESVDDEIECLRELLDEVRQQTQFAEKDKEDALLAKEREKQLEFEKEKL